MGCPADLVGRFSDGARKMYFSKSSIDHFCTSATPGQMRAVCDLLDFEMDVRGENRRRLLMRRVAFPVVKSLDDFDFAEVVMPEGYSKKGDGGPWIRRARPRLRVLREDGAREDPSGDRPRHSFRQ